MRRQLVFVLFSLGFTLSARSQNTFAPIGAEWWYAASMRSYEYWDNFAEVWADQMVSVKDTVIAGQSCRKLTATRHQKDKNHPYTAYVTAQSSFFIYNNQDTVFAFSAALSNFVPLYIFNVQPGDTVCLRSPLGQAANSPFCVVIDSVVTEIYDTTHLRSYYHHNVSGSNIGFGSSYTMPDDSKLRLGKYTDKVGGNWPGCGSFFPGGYIDNADYYKSTGLPTGSLRCYHDAVTAIKMSAVTCDSVQNSYLGVDKPYRTNEAGYIFPNPTSETFTLMLPKSFPKESTVILFNISGQKVHEIIVPAKQSECAIVMPAELPSGLYVLKLSLAEDRFIYRKLILRH
ncbi:MAG: T9SS type A sorting domain-containing protein [Verrucomicrobiaceae bacterium]|nr:MAG: T9SS type A sorting domain-containing protein [Verrucomicrobiaceae bacterium]